MIHPQNPFRLAVVGSPESIDPRMVGRFLDHITARLQSSIQPVTVLCVDCSPGFASVVAEHAREQQWEMEFFEPLDLEPLLDCDAVAAVPGNGDRATWDVIELAADLGKSVRVLTGRADPGPVPGAPKVRIISPDSMRQLAA